MQRAIELDEDEDALFDADERPLPRARRRLPWFRMSLFSGLCIAALAFIAEQERTEPVVGGTIAIPATVLVSPPPTWQVLNPSGVAFSFDKALGPASAEARQHSGGGREDTLVVGAPGAGRYARVTFSYRIPVAPRTFYLDIVRRAAEAGLAVERSGQTFMIATKFGAVETAPVTLTGPAEHGCQAFRFRDDDASFGFQGFVCEPGILPERAACFIDSMTATGTDASLAALFNRLDRGRADNCAFEVRTATIPAKPAAKAPGLSASAFR
jgi:hypothetical protein